MSPGRGGQHAGQLVEEGGLAGAVGADERDDRSARDGEVDVAVGDQPAEPHGDLLGVQERTGLGGRVDGRRGLGHVVTTGLPVSSPGLVRVLILVTLPLVQLRLPLAAGQQPFRSQQHHGDQDGAVDEEPILGELAQQLRQADQHDGADHDAGDVAHAAQDDERQRVDADQDVEALREDDADLGREQRPGQAAERRAEHEREELVDRRVDAGRLRHRFVLAHRIPGAPDA